MRTNTVLSVFSAELGPGLSALSRASWRRQALRYALGLVLLLRFRSVSELARHLAGGAVDALHHFLHDSPWDAQAAQRAEQERLARLARRDGRPIRLIIDDTPVERAGKKIEGLGVHHSAKGLVRGLCAVTAVVRLGGLVLAWAVRGYRAKRGCPAGEFRSKVDLAEEILSGATALGPDVTVLLDAWYTCKRILNRVTRQGWRYVAALKSNRLLVLDGRKTPVRHLAKGPREYRTVRLSRRRKVRVARRLAVLPGVGQVAVFITKTGRKTKFLVSNDLELSAAAAVRLYAERWSIETFHREVKQHLGFGELWVRSWRAVQRHWTLAAAAYNALKLWNAARPARERQRTFGQIIRSFRRLISTEQASLWCTRQARAA